MTEGGGRPLVESRDPALETADDRAVERFLRRVAALDAAAWGRLDAAGQRLLAGDPIARWERARLRAALAGVRPVLETLLASVGFAATAAEDFTRWLGQAEEPWRRSRPMPWLLGFQSAASAGRAAASSTPAARWQRLAGQLDELWDTAAARPGGPEPAHTCLQLALLALRFRVSLPPASFARLYAPVEPVIPAASLH